MPWVWLCYFSLHKDTKFLLLINQNTQTLIFFIPLNLGYSICRRANRTDLCIKMLQKCVSLDPAYTPAYLVLARLSTGPATGTLLRHVVQLQPKNPDHHAEYASWLYQEGTNVTHAWNGIDIYIHIWEFHQTNAIVNESKKGWNPHPRKSRVLAPIMSYFRHEMLSVINFRKMIKVSGQMKIASENIINECLSTCKNFIDPYSTLFQENGWYRSSIISKH